MNHRETAPGGPQPNGGRGECLTGPDGRPGGALVAKGGRAVSPSGRKVGRPLKYATPARLQKAISAYFSRCKKSGEIPRVTALALALGMSRRSLVNYAHRAEFLPTIKRARLRCEDALLKAAREGRIPVALGIFELKNFGWSDRQEIEHSGPDGEPIRFTFDISPSGDGSGNRGEK